MNDLVCDGKRFDNMMQEINNLFVQLQKQEEHIDDCVYFNFQLPLQIDKIDCVWVNKKYILVIICAWQKKQKKSKVVMDVCLLLSYFHAYSRKIPLIPIIFDKSATVNSFLLKPEVLWHNIFYTCYCNSGKSLKELILQMDHYIMTNEFIHGKEWLQSPFAPVVQAGDLRDLILRDPLNASQWFSLRVKDLITSIQALKSSKKQFIFINGLPGSGKSMVKLYLEQTLDTDLFFIFEVNIQAVSQSAYQLDNIINEHIHDQKIKKYICIANQYAAEYKMLAPLKILTKKYSLDTAGLERAEFQNIKSPFFLSASLRPFRCKHIFKFWFYLLSGERVKAADLLKHIPQNNSHTRYRIMLSRNLRDAKNIVSKFRHGSEKTGIIASNQLTPAPELEYSIFEVKDDLLDFCKTSQTVEYPVIQLITLLMKARQGVIIYIPGKQKKLNCFYTYLHKKIGLKTINETTGILELQNIGERK